MKNRDEFQRRLAAAGLVDEVLMEHTIRRSSGAASNSGAEGEGQAEEDEVFLSGDDLGHTFEILALESRAMDAEVGDGRRIGEVEGDPDGVAGARHGFSGSGILSLVVVEVGLLVNDNRGGVADGGGLEGKSLHGSRPRSSRLMDIQGFFFL